MVQTTVFLSNKTQAVRLPKAVALAPGVKEVRVLACGRSRVISPVGESWDAWFAGPTVSENFMVAREQPAEQMREGL